MNGDVSRDNLLARTDLATLATDLCGPPHGHGPNARWHCPKPDHPDRHPSMTIYSGYRNPRWHCHACGAGGTAIDLYATATGTPIGPAIRALAQRAGLDTDDADTTKRPTPRRAVPLPPPPASGTPDPAIERYVAATAELLHGPRGQRARQYLRRRGLTDGELLCINRIGYDPGPHELSRAAGLPRRGRGIVLPVLDDDQRAVFCTVRYLDESAAGRRYDNAARTLAPNPKVAIIRPVDDLHRDSVVVTEGIVDALTAARHGYIAAAVLGAANAGRRASDTIDRVHGDRRILIAFDGDPAGRAAARRLVGTLATRSGAILIGLRHSDLNDQAPLDLAKLLSSAGGSHIDTWSTTNRGHEQHLQPTAEPERPGARASTFGL